MVKLFQEKDKYRKRYRRYNNPRDKLSYEILRENCHKLVDKCYTDYKNLIETSIIERKNTKFFWTFIKDKRGGKSYLPSSMFMNNLQADSGNDIANLFVRHFSSVYSDSSINIGRPTSQVPTPMSNTLCKLELSENEILNKIKKLDSCKGPGPDLIPPVFIKRCDKALTYPLWLIFNKSLALGVFPDEWKKSRITPVFKKGDPKNVTNYRPISILSCFSKLFESLVYPIITRQFDVIISDYQHDMNIHDINIPELI